MQLAGSQVDSALSWARTVEADDPLMFAIQYEGFHDWAHVVRRARELHPVAIELLARRVEGGL
jgi:hypothetical protein